MYCTCCGLCCKKIDSIQLPKQYRYLDRGDGVCRYLCNNLCTIYENRPIICNSEKMYQAYYNKIYDSFEEFEVFLKKCCLEIQDRS